MRNYIAQLNLGPEGGFRGFGPLGLTEGKTGADSPIVFSNVLSTTVGVLTVVAIIWFVIQFFLGAIGIVFSGGDKGKLTEARTKITTAVIGLIVVVVAIFAIDLIGRVLGIENILDITTFINQLGGASE